LSCSHSAAELTLPWPPASLDDAGALPRAVAAVLQQGPAIH
jgi:hypothetical protein